MKKILVTLCLFAMGMVANAATTPEEALTFFNKYVSAANSYSDSITSFYMPDAKIIRTVMKPDGTTQAVVTDTTQYFRQMRIGSNLAKLNKYKNFYSDRKVSKRGSDIKIDCIRKASTGPDRFPAYFVIGENSKGELRIKEEMMYTKQQAILKGAKK